MSYFSFRGFYQTCSFFFSCFNCKLPKALLDFCFAFTFCHKRSMIRKRRHQKLNSVSAEKHVSSKCQTNFQIGPTSFVLLSILCLSQLQSVLHYLSCLNLQGVITRDKQREGEIIKSVGKKYYHINKSLDFFIKTEHGKLLIITKGVQTISPQ